MISNTSIDVIRRTDKNICFLECLHCVAVLVNIELNIY